MLLCKTSAQQKLRTISHCITISTHSLRTKQIVNRQATKSNIDDIHRALSHKNANKALSASCITEIPLSMNLAKLYGLCGFLSGCSLLVIPKRYIESAICLPFPNLHNYDNLRSVDYQLCLAFLVCCSGYAYMAGKLYQYKTFKLGDSKRLYKVLRGLTQRTPLSLIHSTGFVSIVYYGLFGAFTILETVLYGKPYGYESESPYYEHSRFGHPRLVGNDKNARDCNTEQIQNRFKFGLEITTHWAGATVLVVAPYFFCGSLFVMSVHRTQWLSLFSRLRKPI